MKISPVQNIYINNKQIKHVTRNSNTKKKDLQHRGTYINPLYPKLHRHTKLIQL